MSLCPRCHHKEMRLIHVNDVELDFCDTCEGVWFDKDELEQVLRIGESDAAGTELAPSFDSDMERLETPGMGGLKCPRCGSDMFRYNYAVSSGILLDNCENGCGLWLDDGEIRKIFEYAIEADKELDPEVERKLKQKLAVIRTDAKMKEEKLIDSLVAMDNRPGIMSIPGKCLQLIYRGLYKLGL
jgi:uncharacterized protein